MAGTKIQAKITLGVVEGTTEPVLICTVDPKEAILLLAGAIQTLIIGQGKPAAEASPVIVPGQDGK